MGLSVIHMLLKTSVADKIYYEYKGDNSVDRTEEGVKSKKRSKDKTVNG